MAGDGAGGEARDAEARGARGYAARVALFFGALFLVYGIHLPYFPVWLDYCGLDAGEIAIVTAAPFFVRLAVVPSLAILADRFGSHRALTLVMCWAGLGAVLVLSQARGFPALLVLSLVFMIASSAVMPLTEVVALSGVRRRGLDYGRMRLWGSLTFIVASAGGGALIDRSGAGITIWLLTGGVAATVVAAHLLPRPTIGSIADAKDWPGSRPGRAAMLLGSPLFLIFLLAAGSAQGAHATFYTFGVLHWQGQGISAAWTGALWAIAVLAEVALFAYSGLVVRRFGALELLIAGSAAAVVRWAAMALDPPLALLVPLQALHGLSYGATHLGAIHFIGRAIPERAAGTAQALYATVAVGLTMGGATLLSGWLYPDYGAGTYLAMAVLALIGLVAGLTLRRRWSGGELWSDTPGSKGSGASIPKAPGAEG